MSGKSSKANENRVVELDDDHDDQRPLEDDTEEESSAGKIAPVNNGYSTDKYSWSQTLNDVTINVPVTPGTLAKMIDVRIDSKKLRVGLKGQPPILEGELFAAIKPDDVLWNLDDRKLVMITLEKFHGGSWWTRVITSEPELDSKKLEPASAKLSDLDPDVRQTVEKMMFDQRQKSMGRPTSDEMQKQELLKKFAADHPEFDFSQAKIS